MTRRMPIATVYFLTLLTGSVVLAQETAIPRDTSYTVESTLQKVSKQYPDIVAVYSHPSRRITVESEVVYRTIGSRSLTANLFYPKKTRGGKLPAVLMVHGGGWRTGDKSLMTPMAEQIAAFGYIVMAVEYRLSLEAAYPAAVADLYGAILWMHDNADKYFIDTRRLAVLGCSAGGQLAALVGTTYSKQASFHPAFQRIQDIRIGAIIDIDGVLAFKHPDSEEGAMAAQWLGGTYEEKPETWLEASALTHVDEHTPPTLFLSSKYPRFLAGRQDFIRKLNAFGTKSETHYLENAPHSFWLLHPWFEPTVEHVVKFLEETL